jgi:hypothetical protein
MPIVHGGTDDMISIAHARTMATALQASRDTVVAMDDADGDHFSVAEWSYVGPWTLAFLDRFA